MHWAFCVCESDEHCLLLGKSLLPSALPLSVLFNNHLYIAYLSFAQNFIVLKVFSQTLLSLMLARF